MEKSGRSLIRNGIIMATIATIASSVILLLFDSVRNAAAVALLWLWHDDVYLLLVLVWGLVILGLLALAEISQAEVKPERAPGQPSDSAQRKRPAAGQGDDPDAWNYLLGEDAQQYRCHKRTGRVERLVGTGRDRRWEAV